MKIVALEEHFATAEVMGFPNLTIVTGHWGEVVLFYLDRGDMLSGAAKLPRTISEYFRHRRCCYRVWHIVT
jgi:predicted TIM-barrel fold metal-dependent hydrolase